MRTKRFAIVIEPSAGKKQGPATGWRPGSTSSTTRFDDWATDQNQIRACSIDPNSNQLIYNEAAVVRALANHPMKR